MSVRSLVHQHLEYRLGLVRGTSNSIVSWINITNKSTVLMKLSSDVNVVGFAVEVEIGLQCVMEHVKVSCTEVVGGFSQQSGYREVENCENWHVVGSC